MSLCTEDPASNRSPKNTNFTSLSVSVLHIAIRIALANAGPIADCDEVYNYWEPVHFLHYQSGMQTWEYAPQYALRTYAYLVPMAWLSKIYAFLLRSSPILLVSLLTRIFDPTGFTDARNDYSSDGENENKVLIFCLLRCTLALFTALSELRLYTALEKNLSSSRRQVEQQDQNKTLTTCPTPLIVPWTLFISLTSTGMFHASSAYVPSATAMIFWMNSAACQLNSFTQNFKSCDLDEAIFWGLLAILITGWPFCVVMFIPLGIVAMYVAGARNSKGWTFWPICRLLNRTIFRAVLIQGIVMLIDFIYYGRILSPTLNIFIYNTGLFGGDGINRDYLYGVEGIDYYVKNLLLNCNAISLAGLFALPSLLVERLLGRRRNRDMGVELVMFPMFLWIGLFFTRPHKEERFLYILYPIFAMGSTVLLDQIMEITFIHETITKVLTKKRMIQHDNPESARRKVKLGIGLLVLLPAVVLSILRSMALVDNYTAPLKLYSHLYNHVQSHPVHLEHSLPLLICIAGEWHRFPSSFFLPYNTRLAFLKSSFDGQLPQEYTNFGSKEDGISIQRGTFNDMNEGSEDRYVDFNDCSYVIEMVKNTEGDGSINDQPECVQYMHEDENNKWREVVHYDFMDAENTSMLHRIIYVPFLRKVTYNKYSLFEKISKVQI